MNNSRYILLDRDGTIIVERNYLSTAAGGELLPGAIDGLRRLQGLGFGLIVITNQSGIGRGMLTEATLEEIHTELRRQLAAGGVRIDAFYHCPHVPEDACECRKPKPLLVFRAASDFGFDPRHSFVIGDKPADIELGKNCGAGTILVRTGYGREFEAAGLIADYTADDLKEAAGYIQRLLPVEAG
jgi:D-glycero-D-manno-heptose 1,7-bisphosphate phosphatase